MSINTLAAASASSARERPSGAKQHDTLPPSSRTTQNQPALQPSMPMNVRAFAMAIFSPLHMRQTSDE